MTLSFLDSLAAVLLTFIPLSLLLNIKFIPKLSVYKLLKGITILVFCFSALFFGLVFSSYDFIKVLPLMLIGVILVIALYVFISRKIIFKEKVVDCIMKLDT